MLQNVANKLPLALDPTAAASSSTIPRAHGLAPGATGYVSTSVCPTTGDATYEQPHGDAGATQIQVQSQQQLLGAERAGEAETEKGQKGEEERLELGSQAYTANPKRLGQSSSEQVEGTRAEGS